MAKFGTTVVRKTESGDVGGRIPSRQRRGNSGSARERDMGRVSVPEGVLGGHDYAGFPQNAARSEAGATVNRYDGGAEGGNGFGQGIRDGSQ
jgi:hypothetical protein